MSKPKWYNWVGNSDWDDYCRIAWLVIILPGLAILLLLAVGIATGKVRVVS